MKQGSTLRSIILILFAYISLASSAAKPTATQSIPDFAYPQTVSTDALKQIKTALSAGDENKALRSLIDYSLAQSSIGSEKSADVIKEINDVTSKLHKTDSRAIAKLLLATVYCDLFKANSYTYNSRDLPITPLSDDYTEWSGDQFRTIITNLCSEALKDRIDLQKAPLSDYTSLVTVESGSLVYFPTLYDFIAHRSINILGNLNRYSAVLGIATLSPRATFMLTPPMVLSDEQIQKILYIYANLLQFHVQEPAAEIYCDIQRIIFTHSHTYSNLSDESDSTATRLLMALYNDYAASEYSGNILIALGNYAAPLSKSGELTTTAYYNMLTQYAARYPSFHRIDCIRSQLAQLSQPNIVISSPGQVAPSVPFEATVTVSNLSKVTVNLYRVANQLDKYDNEVSTSVKVSDLQGLKPISQVTLDFTDSIPFLTKRNLSFTVPETGIYCLVPAEKQPGDRRKSYTGFRATRLASGIMVDSLNTSVFVIDPLTGRPVDGASIIFGANRTTPSSIGRTDADGFLTLHPKTWSSVRPVIGNDIYAPAQYIEAPLEYVTDWVSTINAYTDLPLYHPGDSVNWCAIAYRFRQEERQLLDNTSLTAILYNANSIPVDTLESTTDSWGRVNGAFKIPEGELTGSYRIVFQTPKSKSVIGMTYFTVSDYKLPTYYLSLDRPASGIPTAGDVTITGFVKTYSGVPLGGIPVKAELSASVGGYWMRSNSIRFCSLADTTSADGRFTLELTKSMIENSPAPHGLFTALVSATSLSGESQQISTDFTVGETYMIRSKLPEEINTDHPINIEQYFSLINSRGEQIATPLTYTLVDTRQPSDTIRGSLSTSVNWSKLSTSTYSLTVTAPDYAAQPLTASLILYRTKAQVSPVDALLWSPDRDITITSGRKARLKVYVANENQSETHALLVISTPTSILSSQWIKLNKGYNEVNVTIPDNLRSINADLISILNYNRSKLNFTLSTAEPIPSLSILTESFRDRLIPGGRETWTFRSVGADSAGVQSAMILGMYNDALHSLAPYDWSLDFAGYTPLYTSISLNYSSSSVGNGFYPALSRGGCDPINPPRLQTYGLSFSPLMMSRSNRLYKYATAGNAKMPVFAEADLGGVVNDCVLTEEFSAEKVAEHADQTADSPSATAPDFVYRDSETPIAFFAPTLSTDTTGHLSYSFSVPNANTTWNFTAMAYDRLLSSSVINKKIVANKPVMVQPNLPRFLRSGDEIILPATVINNSDSAMTVKVDIQFFAPADMQVISSDTISSLHIAPGATSVVSTTLTAPSDAPWIGYRIKVATPLFADGEQTLIPILEASQPVIESQPFYIAPDSTRFSMRLGQYGSDARVSLQYCDNPTWYVVTALPGLASSEPRTAPQAADAIFSAAVAEGLLTSVPHLAEALQEWLHSDGSDSTLVSMLSRNSDLKTVLLQATPWMLDARSDTERMQRLALLFDKKQIAATYSSAIDLLSRLSRSDGGWAWVNQLNESSPWATYQTLITLGRLRELGFLPDNPKLRSMINSSIAYYAKVTEQQYRHSRSADYTSYIILLDLFPSYRPSTTSSAIIAATVQKALSGWKRYSLPRKADAALILYRHGYKRIAAQVLESIRQFAVTSPSQGMHFPLAADMAGGSMTELTLTARILQLFHIVSPSDEAVDPLRQWLIIQKEARDWGNSSSASEVCAAILLTSPRWIEPSGSTSISVGSTEISLTPEDKFTGYVRTDISSICTSGAELKVSKSISSPSWGAVIARSTLPMDSVSAYSIPELSLEKRFYKLTPEGWTVANDLRVGDRVKVELTIHASRAIDYVAIDDHRAACLEPVEQLPTPIWSEGVCFYRENRDETTNLFLPSLPAGTYRLSYEMWVNTSGSFASGIATIQSQYAPSLSAHSAGAILRVAK